MIKQGSSVSHTEALCLGNLIWIYIKMIPIWLVVLSKLNFI